MGRLLYFQERPYRFNIVCCIIVLFVLRENRGKMSDVKDTPPLMDDLFDRDEDSDDLFASAVSDEFIFPPRPNPSNPVPELPTLQLNMTRDEVQSPSTPGEDMPVHVDVILSSPVSPPVKTLPTISESQNGEFRDYFYDISVRNGTKVGDGMGAYVSYKVDSKSNLQFSKKSNNTVQRRFSDFLGLHDKLTEKYLRNGRIIPPAPEKSLAVMTKVKMSQNEQMSPQTDERIERRRASLERYLQRIATHPILGVDPDFKEFMESDIELPKAVNTSALSGAGVMRLFNKVGETVIKITFKMEENDQWFEEKMQEIELLETGIRRMHSSIENLVITRKDLAQYTGNLAKSCAMLSNCEEHTPLSRCLTQLAELLEKVETLSYDQSNTDFSRLCETLKDYIALINAVKDVFHERVKVYQNWQHSLLMLNKKREYKAKMDLANKQDKSNLAMNEITEWEAKVDRCQEEFDQISKVIKKEVERFETIRVSDFKSIFIKYMEEQMKNQQQLVKFWEAFLPDAKAVA